MPAAADLWVDMNDPAMKRLAEVLACALRAWDEQHPDERPDPAERFVAAEKWKRKSVGAKPQS